MSADNAASSPARPGPICPNCQHDLRFQEYRKIRGYAGDHDRGRWICSNRYCERDQEVEIR